MDDTREFMSHFMDKIHQAKLTGAHWVETTAEIIAHLNPRGLGGAEYFIYNGIKVCEKGKAKEVQEKMDRQLGRDIHGDGEAKVIS